MRSGPIATSLVLLLLSLVCPLGAAEEEAEKPVHPLDGAWRWSFTMPDGTASRPKVVLAVKQGSLTGIASFRPGTETPITNAVLKGDQLKFEVVRERDGQEIVTTYTGTWNAKSIKGKVESNWAGQKQSYQWEAQRAHLGAEGTWRWPFSFRTGGRPFQARVDLEQEGETLTGTMPGWGRSTRKTEIKNGTIKNGEIYFETERGSDENKQVTIYKGKQKGDTIDGTIEFTDFEGNERKDKWEAKRVD
jgi:hypothetical protein